MAVQFDSTGDLLYRLQSSGLIPAATPLSACFYLRVDADSGQANPSWVRYADAAGTIRQMVQVNSTGATNLVQVEAQTSGGSSPGVVFTLGAWRAVGIKVHDNGDGTVESSLYVDGVFVESQTSAMLADTSTAIAWGGTGGDTPKQSIAFGRVWQAELSAPEFLAEATATAPVRTANLAADYRFASSALTTDSSGNGRTLTSNGSPTFVADPSFGTTAAITGVAATGAVGTLGKTVTSTKALTGVAATGQPGTLTAVVSAIASLTGVSASGQVGTPVAAASSTATLSGVAATGAAASPTARADSLVALAGVTAAGAVGAIAASAVASTTLAGVAAVGAAGTLAASADASTLLTGVAGVGAVGTVTAAVASADAAANVPAVAATGAIGSPTITASSVATLQQISATGAVGTLSASSTADAAAQIAGVAATGAAAALRTAVDSLVAVNGVAGQGAVGTPATAVDSAVTLPAAVGTGAAGQPVASVSTDAAAALSGVAATGAVRAPSAAADSVAAVTGVAAAGAVGALSIDSNNASVTLSGLSADGVVGDLVVVAPAAFAGLDGAGVGHRVQHVIDRSYRKSAVVVLPGLAAQGAVGQPQINPGRQTATIRAITPADIEATQRVRIAARLDAAVVLDPLKAEIPAFRKGVLGAPELAADAELEEFVMLIAAGWK